MPFDIAKILPPLPASVTAKSLLETIQPGQILRGTALSENINGAMRLQIGVTQLTAQTTLSVSPGQPLLLQVEKAGQLPELRVLMQPSQKELTAWALKNNLPRQQPLPQLFKALTEAVGRSPTQLVQEPVTRNLNQALPGPVKQAIEQILTRTLSVDNPSFKSEMGKALQLSGTQTELQLIRQFLPKNDLKLNLLRLIGLIKPYISQTASSTGSGLSVPAHTTTNTASKASLQMPIQPLPLPPSPQAPISPQTAEADTTVKLLLDLFKHIDGAIARIQTNQLSSLPTDDSARQIWQFELPIRHGNGFDLFHVKIARDDQHGASGSQPGWQLTLHMDLSPLGPMRIRLHLIGEALSTTIWSENPDTSALVNQHLNRLRSGFESAGLEVNKLEAFQGSARNEFELPNDQSLLNEKV
ncbi:MAG: flagellar hook-length control protein FliK [Candidatus Thiodiazotropha sp. LLP2]